jgi:hypothetical protein
MFLHFPVNHLSGSLPHILRQDLLCCLNNRMQLGKRGYGPVWANEWWTSTKLRVLDILSLSLLHFDLAHSRKHYPVTITSLPTPPGRLFFGTAKAGAFKPTCRNHNIYNFKVLFSVRSLHGCIPCHFRLQVFSCRVILTHCQHLKYIAQPVFLQPSWWRWITWLQLAASFKGVSVHLQFLTLSKHIKTTRNIVMFNTFHV